MNTKSKEDRHRNLSMDTVANAVVVVTGVLIVLVAAIAANIDAAPEYAQTVHQDAGRHIVLIASRLNAENA
jgi:hypothetical protein